MPLGIGYAIARRFLEEGARVVATARKAEALDHTITELGQLGDVVGVPGDVSGAEVAFVRACALDLAERGIRINGVLPGLIRTPLAAPIVDDPIAAAEYLQTVPMRRFGEPAEVASVVCFLASDESSSMTGENLVVDGGTTLGTILPVTDMEMPGFDAGNAPHLLIYRGRGSGARTPWTRPRRSTIVVYGAGSHSPGCRSERSGLE